MKTISTLARRSLAIATLGLASAFVPVAQADDLSISDWAAGHQSFGTSQGNFSAGGLAGEWAGNDDAVFWCIQLNQYISVPGGPYHDYVATSDGDPVPGVDPEVVTLLGQLFTQAYGFASAPPPPSYPGANPSAAFQLAVWEIVYDHSTYTGGNPSGLSLSGGSFEVTSGNANTRSLAQDWLDALAGFTDSYHLTFLQSPKQQDFVYFGGRSQQVPEPHGLALVGIAMLAALGVLRRRRHLPAN